MKRFYSQSTGCTYLSGISPEMPEDAVEISESVFLSVIARPVPGKVRAHDAAGQPLLIDPPALTAEQIAANERTWRDAEVASVVWLRDRHRDQLEISVSTTLTAEQFNELLVYMQALRDWPQSPDFPDSQHRPAAPAWIAEQAQ